MLILARWLYYAVVVSSVRNRLNIWQPFAAPPFGLDTPTYTAYQAVLAVPFGFVLMGSMSCAVYGFLRLNGRPLSYWHVSNVLGIVYFLPFAFLQPVDLLLGLTQRWDAWHVVPIHTAVLVWESVAAATVLSRLSGMGRGQTIASAVILVAVWIAICAALWR